MLRGIRIFKILVLISTFIIFTDGVLLLTLLNLKKSTWMGDYEVLCPHRISSSWTPYLTGHGIYMILISVMGSIAVIQENRHAIMIYIIMMGFCLFANISTSAGIRINFIIPEYVADDVFAQDGGRKALGSFEEKYKCCGITDYQDYDSYPNNTPNLCYTKEYRYTGCFDKLKDYLDRTYFAFVFFVGFTQLANILLSIILYYISKEV